MTLLPVNLLWQHDGLDEIDELVQSDNVTIAKLRVPTPPLITMSVKPAEMVNKV